MELLLVATNYICTVVQTVALVMIAFELNPWKRKDDNGK